MTSITPALLERSYDSIVDGVGMIYHTATRVQIDVCDGIFTRTRTWPYVGEKAHFQKLITGEEGLPHWDTLDFEVDLMVAQSECVLEHYLAAGFQRAVVHFRSPHNMRECRDAVQSAMLLGVALTVHDDPESAAGDIALADFIQVMGIEQVGVQGSAFTEQALSLIAVLRREYPDLEIQVDGGVTLENAERILDAGASTLVVGSAIFESSNPRGALRELQSI